MRATIDKFGRVLIPKKLRDEAGIDNGTEFELEFDPFSNSIILKQFPAVQPYVEYTEWGWPVIMYQEEEKVDFDIKNFINEGHEERGRKLLGLDD